MKYIGVSELTTDNYEEQLNDIKKQADTNMAELVQQTEIKITYGSLQI